MGLDGLGFGPGVVFWGSDHGTAIRRVGIRVFEWQHLSSVSSTVTCIHRVSSIVSLKFYVYNKRPDSNKNRALKCERVWGLGGTKTDPCFS